MESPGKSGGAGTAGRFEVRRESRRIVGLRIMRERAQNIGATVEVASVPGSGTCVVLKLPERLGLAA